MKKLLIVDDERSQRELLLAVLKTLGHECELASNGAEGLSMASSGQFDLVMLDVRMPVVDGMSVLDSLMETMPGLPVVMMTAYGDVEMAVDAMKRGAADFLLKPLDITRLEGLVTRLLESGGRPAPQQGEEDPLEFVGRSVAARKVRELVRIAARSNAGILLTGESGTGKDVVASAIHRMGPRSGGPFVAINCAAVPPQLMESELFGHEKGAFTDAVATKIGKFEAAHGGTLLLDDSDPLSGAFTKSARALARALFPHERLETVPVDHTVFKTFYLLDRAYGRKMEDPRLAGVQLDRRMALFISPNDILGAFQRDSLGGWAMPVSPGGEEQRELALR